MLFQRYTTNLQLPSSAPSHIHIKSHALRVKVKRESDIASPHTEPKPIVPFELNIYSSSPLWLRLLQKYTATHTQSPRIYIFSRNSGRHLLFSDFASRPAINLSFLRKTPMRWRTNPRRWWLRASYYRLSFDLRRAIFGTISHHFVISRRYRANWNVKNRTANENRCQSCKIYSLWKANHIIFSMPMCLCYDRERFVEGHISRIF